MTRKRSQSGRARKYIAVMLAVVLIMPFILINESMAADQNTNLQQLYNHKIARGIFFQANNYNDYQGTGQREREYIITADLSDPTVQAISGKANDKVLKLGTVSSQIAEEQGKGRNVVAGINGDMFNISLGTMHYGEPLGLQVKDGKMLVGFSTVGSASRFPVFAIDKNRKAMIAYLSMDNQLSVVDSKYEKAYGLANPNLTTTIDTINRINTQIMGDKMILITPQLADHPTVGFTNEQAANGTLTVLKNISGENDGSVRLGQEYEADVVSIIDTSTASKSITIPSDGMVLASQGIKATWVKEHLKTGDKVRFSFNLKDQSNKRLELDQAVTAWLPLVENGQALTRAHMTEKCKYDWDRGATVIDARDKARTAIGFTRDNKVVALVFDGGGAGRDSYGLNLPDMAIRMQQLGAVAAVSLDGGGSTQINTRLFGETKVNVINNTSDGKERPVSNTILFASNVSKSNDVKELMVNRDITIFKNTTYAFQVRGQDSNGNPVDLSKADIKWSLNSATGANAVKNNGSIDKKGVFTAGTLPGIVTVEASLGDVKAVARVNVVGSIDRLAFTESGILAVKPNVPKQLQLTAFTREGQSIVIFNNAAQWSVTPSSIATINQQGLLTPLGKGTGVVSAKVGNQEALFKFVSGQDVQLIDSYENRNASYYIDGYVGGRCDISKAQARDGQHSLRVDYDYGAWSKVNNGTINIRMNNAAKDPRYTSLIRPKKLAMWVYGDGKAPWLRAIIKDGNGNAHTINLASRINWVGWRHVSVDIPADIPTPITLDYFYMVETDKSKNLQGTVYFDDVSFIYLE